MKRILPNLMSFLSGAIVAGSAILIVHLATSNFSQVRFSSPPDSHVAAIYVGTGIAFIVLLFCAFPGSFVRVSRPPAVFANRREISATSVALQKQFSQFLKLIDESVTNAERHHNALNIFDERLRNASSDGVLRIIIRDLIKSNELYRHKSSELELRLGEARLYTQQLQERVRQAERMASVDPLTGIANRRKFDDELQRLVALSHEEKTPLCLVMADIDHFKAVNDVFGHRAGDAILRQFAELLSANVRTTDIVARYGGEEFSLILPKAPLGNGLEIAERARAAVQANVWANFENCERVTLTASFGIADIREGEHPNDLIKRADAKLYEAKTNGRNRVAMWHSIE